VDSRINDGNGNESKNEIVRNVGHVLPTPTGIKSIGPSACDGPNQRDLEVCKFTDDVGEHHVDNVVQHHLKLVLEQGWELLRLCGDTLQVLSNRTKGTSGVVK
jgi:hypothetical protein